MLHHPEFVEGFEAGLVVIGVTAVIFPIFLIPLAIARRWNTSKEEEKGHEPFFPSVREELLFFGIFFGLGLPFIGLELWAQPPFEFALGITAAGALIGCTLIPVVIWKMRHSGPIVIVRRSCLIMGISMYWVHVLPIMLASMAS